MEVFWSLRTDRGGQMYYLERWFSTGGVPGPDILFLIMESPTKCVPQHCHLSKVKVDSVPG